MKVAFITSSFFPNFGGAEVFLHNLIKFLQRNHQVKPTLYIPFTNYRCLDKNGFLRKVSYQLKSLPPLLFRLPIIMNFLSKRYLQKEQDKEKYNLWHATFAYPAGYLISKLRGVPKLLRSPGEDIQIEKSLDYGMRRDSKVNAKVALTLRKMDALVAMSETMKQNYLDIFPEASDRIQFIPNGIPIERYRSHLGKIEIRKKLKLPLEKKIILTVGRNHRKKGFDRIPKMVSILSQRRNDFIWVVLGKDTSKIKEADTYGAIKNNLFLLDQIGFSKTDHFDLFPNPHLLDYYLAADLFAFPSLFESFGIVLTEVMAAHLPIVTTFAPGCRDVIENEVTGLQTEPNDVEAMVDAIDRLLNDFELQKRLVENSWNYVRQKFDINQIAGEYFSLYNKLALKSGV